MSSRGGKNLANLHHNQNTQESSTIEELMPVSVVSKHDCIIPHENVISKLQCIMWKGVRFLKGKKSIYVSLRHRSLMREIKGIIGTVYYRARERNSSENDYH